MTNSERAIQAVKSLERPGDEYVAVFDVERPYIVFYSDSTIGDPWKVRGYAWSIPLYFHRRGAILPTRPK